MNIKRHGLSLLLILSTLIFIESNVLATVLSVQPDINALSTSDTWQKDWKKYKELSVVRDEAVTSGHRKLLEYSVSLGFDGREWRSLYRWIGEEARFQGTRFRPYSKSF